MPRYFIEVAYEGTHYSGFQRQENAITIQSEVEAAFQTIHRTNVPFTGSSRTDAGVHALQNYFHFDFEQQLHPEVVYKLNAILPGDIVVRKIIEVPLRAHSRFDALSRQYSYHIHRFKDPFLSKRSFYYPYTMDLQSLQEAASLIATQADFTAFCKTNTQVSNFNCTIYKSEWREEGERLVYTIEANRFLRGMVRLLTAIQLQVGRGRWSIDDVQARFATGKKCGLSVPSGGLFLNRVTYQMGII